MLKPSIGRVGMASSLGGEAIEAGGSKLPLIPRRYQSRSPDAASIESPAKHPKAAKSPLPSPAKTLTLLKPTIGLVGGPRSHPKAPNKTGGSTSKTGPTVKSIQFPSPSKAHAAAGGPGHMEGGATLPFTRTT